MMLAGFLLTGTLWLLYKTPAKKWTNYEIEGHRRGDTEEGLKNEVRRDRV